MFDVWFDNSLSWDFALLKDAHSMNTATSHLNQELKSLGLDSRRQIDKEPERIGGGRRGSKSLKALMDCKKKEKGSQDGLNLEQQA